LIKTSPIAETCYPGSGQDLADCDYISREWPVEDFQTSQAIGRVLPYNVTCPPVDYKAGERPTASCILGINPVYAVNATCQADIKATLEFAQKHNVRLVTTGTGHDLLGRSDGYGSLQVWLRVRSRPVPVSSLFSLTSNTVLSQQDHLPGEIRRIKWMQLIHMGRWCHAR
jgi:hypothetical protein